MIRNKKNKLLTLLVAGVIGTAAMGGAVMSSYTANADESTYSLSTVFTTSQAILSKNGTGETGDFKMEISNGGKVSYTRDLALKWYEKSENTVQEKYMNMDFTLVDTDFTELVFTFESASLTATKDDKAINKVVFTKNGDDVKVSVNDSTALFDVDVTKKLTLSLKKATEETDSFDVELKEDGGATNVIGSFKNIGVNFAEYDTSKKIYSFSVTASAEDEAKATLLLHQINGQSLTLNKDNRFVDDTAPVLVVNEDIDGYVLGTAFALDYEVIDVLDRTVTKNLKYYQYDPDDAAAAKKEFDESTAADKKMKAPEYQTLSTTTYFLETNYTYKNAQEEDVKTTVFSQAGMEYVSIKITLTDDGANEYDYFLDWYLEKAREQVNTTDTTKFVFDAVDGYTTGIDYVKVYANDEGGAKYTFVELDETNRDDLKNKFTETQEYKDFRKALEDLEKDEKGNLLLSAGEGSYLYLPSMKGLFTDNGGYSNLKFTISYKTTSNNTAKTTSGLSASSLKLEVTEAGTYEFKVFAVDKAGNNMKYYLDGELVDVTASNIWSIEEIPSFSVKVAHKGLTIEEASKKRETEVLYGTYDLPNFDIIGNSNVSTKYALFYIDQSKVENTLVSKLYEVSFSSIANRAKTLKSTVEERGLDLYKLAYAMEVTGSEDEARALIKDAFLEIDEYNDKIDKELHAEDWKNSDNDYAWKPDSRTFSPQKTGLYLVLAYFTDPDVAAYDAGAYVVVSVEAKEDVIKGESQWLKNNVASVILFGIAGLMLVLIIILLVVKPSDETLEDYDEPKTKKAKKSKKEKADEKALEELDKE